MRRLLTWIEYREKENAELEERLKLAHEALGRLSVKGEWERLADRPDTLRIVLAFDGESLRASGGKAAAYKFSDLIRQLDARFEKRRERIRQENEE